MTPEEIHHSVLSMGKKAKAAAHALAQLSAEKKSAILLSMAQALRDSSAEIIEANQKDLSAGTEKGLSGSLLDRLKKKI